MRRVWAGAAVAALALAAAPLALRRPETSAPVAPVVTASAPVRHQPVARSWPAPAARSDVAAPARASAGARPREDASSEENELRALEDQSLRQIDVVPLLRAAGIDLRALEGRPDANDILRHVAADELLTRSMMRDLLANTIYPYGYPRERALGDARSASNRMVAALSRQARIALLETALADGSSAEPEPSFYGPDSGRVFAEGERGDAAPQ